MTGRARAASPLAIRSNGLAQARILGDAGAGQCGAVFEEDGIESARMLALAGDTFEPKAIRDEQVVESCVQAAEEHAGRAAA